MIALAADENFNNDIVRGLIRRNPQIDIVRVQDAGLGGADDLDVLEWAADESRILLTHDVATMTRHAYQRVEAGLSMPGVFEVSLSVEIGAAIEDLLLIVECSLDDEWKGAGSLLAVGVSGPQARANLGTTRSGIRATLRASERIDGSWRAAGRRFCWSWWVRR